MSTPQRSAGRRAVKLVGVAAAAALTLAGCGSSSDTGASSEKGTVSGGKCELKDTVKIGAVFSQTGPLAAYGASQAKGAKLAIKEFNKEGGVKYELAIEDDTSQAPIGVARFKKLVDEKVVGIVGPTSSTIAFAAMPPTNAAKVNVVAVSNTAPGIAEIGDYVFRVSLPETTQIPAAVKVAKAKDNIKKVGLIYDQSDAASKAGHDLFVQAFKDEGIELVADKAFASGDVDFSAQLTEIKKTHPDAIVIASLAEEGGPVISQARKMGIDVPLIGNNGMNSPQIIKIAGSDANGLIVGSAWSPSLDTPENNAFLAAYQAEYGAAPDQFAPQVYTAMLTLKSAVDSACSTDATKVRDELAKLSDFKAPIGTFSFDKIGDIQQDALVLQIEDGKYVVAE
jgi:branched-chain amino acid transport system substrate-binding protein